MLTASSRLDVRLDHEPRRVRARIFGADDDLKSLVQAMDRVQHVERRRLTDGTQHGLRARSARDPCQHPFPRVRPVSPCLQMLLIPHTRHIRTSMTEAFLSKNPELEKRWSNLNPLGRLGKVHEVRGVIAWLASDASTFCTGSEYALSC